MPGDRCIVCGNTRSKDRSVSLHRFPKVACRRRQWKKALALKNEDIKDYHRVCSRHFVDADPHNKPELSIGKRFASPKKSWTSRAMRSKTRAWREVVRSLPLEVSSSSSRSVTPATQSVTSEPQSSSPKPPLVATGSEKLDSDFSIDEPQTDVALSESECSMASIVPLTVLSSENAAIDQNTQVLVNTALLARIEALEAENKRLKEHTSTTTGPSCNRKLTFSDIAANDGLVKLYTGFKCHEDFMSFYEFLGPAVDELKYWGDKEFTRKRQRKRKLSSLDQLLLTLMKLKLNLRNKDIAFRFGISESLVSRYICT